MKRFEQLCGESPTLEDLLNNLPASSRVLAVYPINGKHVAWVEHQVDLASAEADAPAQKRARRKGVADAP
jgi:hypothetical protein